MGFTPDQSSLCEGEPIDRPGAIQPHGVLLVLDEAGAVTQLAGDTARAVGLAPGALLGRPVAVLVDRVGRSLADALGQRITHVPGGAAPGAAVSDYVGRWSPTAPGRDAWDVTLHAHPAGTVLEFEPAPPADRSAAEGMAELARAVAALDAAQSLEELFQAAAVALRRITGFDRVLVYRLDDGAGTVVAESHGAALPSLLHQRLPGSDIPPQARRWHLRKRCCVIVDTNGTPAPLRTAGNADAAAAPLDMSDCVLRSASPVHLQQLKDMGVAASMSLPVVVDHRLWGLIACHHATPRHVPYELREACRHVGALFARRIGTRQETGHYRQRASLRGVRADWLERLRLVIEAGGPIELDLEDLACMIPCDGVALVSADRVERFGRTPDEAQLVALADWLEGRLQRGVFATHQLARELPAASAYAAAASGALAVAVEAPDPVVILWFRVGEIAPVTWTGRPDDATDQTASSEAPLPRASRSSLTPTGHGAARTWTRAEIGAARQLGAAIGALVQQQTLRDLNGRLREALAEQRTLVAQKNLLMQEVHHRVQNSLQIVNSMLQLQARQTDDARVRGQFESAVNRLMAVSAVHRHLWQSSDARNVHLGPYFQELCADLTRSWGDGWAGQVTVRAAELVIPSQIAVTLALLVTELLTNAAKYAYAGAPGPVAVSVLEADDGALRVSVSDQGRGMQPTVHGSGLGSKLIRIFTRQLGGQVETQTGAGGTTITIAIPLSRRYGTEPMTPLSAAPA